MAHTLGHTLQAEQDQRVDLLERALTHAKTSACSTSITAKDGITTTHLRCGAGRSTRPSSIPQVGSSAARLRARLLALHYLDARPGLGDARLSRTDGSSFSQWMDCRQTRDDGCAGESSARLLRLLYSTSERIGRHLLLGYRRAAVRPAGRLAGETGGSLQRLRAGRRVGQRHRRARIASPRSSYWVQPATSTHRPASPLPTNCCRNPISQSTLSTRACSCIVFTIAPTDGTTSPPTPRFLAGGLHVG